MAKKLFPENDDWDDSGLIDFNFSSNKKKAEKKNVEEKTAKKLKTKKRKHEIQEDNEEPDSVGGRFVKAPKYSNDEMKDTVELGKTKNNKRKQDQKNQNQNEESNQPKKLKKSDRSNESTSSSFADKLRENLKGSRFRFINEQMYTTTGSEATKLFKEDPTLFEVYHEGYRHQIAQWPMNPLDRIINGIKRMPKTHVVADMGCGEARLSKSVQQKVYSLDLVSNAENVIACNMAQTPLKSNSVNVVVYCLSLMGTDLKDFFLEANRILQIGGIIKIAEVSSRFDNVDKFIESVEKCGFELISKDLSHNLFYFINLKKTHDVNAFNKKINDFSLKPCLYKKR